MGLDWQKAISKAAWVVFLMVLVSFAGTDSVYAQSRPTHKKKVLETRESRKVPKNTRDRGRKSPRRNNDRHNNRKEVNNVPPGRGSGFRGSGKKQKEKGGKLPSRGDKPDFGGEMPRSGVPQGGGTGHRGGRKGRKQAVNDKKASPASSPVFDGSPSQGRTYPTRGTNYQGNRNAPSRKKASPGTTHSGDIDVLSLPKNDMYQQQKKTTYLKYEKKKGPARGTRYQGDISYNALKKPKGHGGSDYEGNLKMWRQPDHNYTPGTVYSGDRKRPKKRKQAQGTEYTGDLKLWRQPDHNYTPGTTYKGDRKQPKKPQQSPGTEYTGDLKLWKQPDHSYTPGTTYKGDRKRPKKPQQSEGTEFAGTLDRRDYEPDLKNQKRMAAYTGTLKARTQKQKDRYYQKMSGKMANYTGDFKIKRRKYKDMHPSASHRYAKNISGQQNRERFRKFRLWWTGLWNKTEQPDAVTEKERKPRFDKGESEIWNY